MDFFELHAEWVILFCLVTIILRFLRRQMLKSIRPRNAPAPIMDDDGT